MHGDHERCKTFFTLFFTVRRRRPLAFRPLGQINFEHCAVLGKFKIKYWYQYRKHRATFTVPTNLPKQPSVSSVGVLVFFKLRIFWFLKFEFIYSLCLFTYYTSYPHPPSREFEPHRKNPEESPAFSPTQDCNTEVAPLDWRPPSSSRGWVCGAVDCVPRGIGTPPPRAGAPAHAARPERAFYALGAAAWRERCERVWTGPARGSVLERIRRYAAGAGVAGASSRHGPVRMQLWVRPASSSFRACRG